MRGRRLWQILLPPATQYSIEERQLRETLEVFLPHKALLHPPCCFSGEWVPWQGCDVPDATAAVEVHGLIKSYGAVTALAGINLRIARGEVFALLGPNGAGKSTTVEILEGYRRRDAGEVSVLGFDPGRQRRRLKPKVGIVLQSTGIDQYLTVAESIRMYAGYYPRPRAVDEVIDLVGLREKRDARVVKLSGGQQRRLDVAIAIVGDPDMLFLDEPTTGFDPSARHEAWQVVKDLASLGTSILLTTHYMDEAQALADRVAVIAHGRIVAQGTPITLGGRDAARARVRYQLPPSVTPPAAFAVPGSAGDTFEFAADDLTRALHELTSWAVGAGVRLGQLEIVRPSLEDVYLELTAGPRVEPTDPE
jgi:ABC-2 type transport system ATP-binding protein